MSLSAPIYVLKRKAKLLSREADIPLNQALNRIAKNEGFDSWSLLIRRSSKKSQNMPASIEYFKLQAENLFKDYETKKPVFDTVINDYLFEYRPKYFDVDSIIVDYDLDEKNFSLVDAQDVIAYMAGFEKWTDLIKASEAELNLAKLLFDNQDKIDREDWQMYIGGAEDDNGTTFDAEARLEIFKHVFVNVDGHHNPFGDYRLSKRK
jgi:hypothetical protein